MSFKGRLKNLGAFWRLTFYLTTVLFVISLIIYGFDISVPEGGRRKALTSQINNSGQINYFYKINDKFCFSVFTDRDPEYGGDVGITTYDLNYVPWCFFCGWYTGDPEDDRGFIEPYRQGDLLYDIDSSMSDYNGLPPNVYGTFNLKSGEYSYVSSLDEISPDATDVSYRVTREWVSENYDEISYSSSDDEDCFISFGAVFLLYSILIVWGLLVILIKKPQS